MDFALVRADNPGPMTLTGTNTYVVGRAPAWVIDPGPDDPAHLAAVRAEGDRRGGIEGVVLTHSHADHSAGAGSLGAPLAWGAVTEADEGSWRPGPPQSFSRPQGPETVGPFAVIPTPGHAFDHVCFRWKRMLFCGDLVLGEGSTIVPPLAFGGSLGDYLRSLRRVRELDVDRFAPGHGPMVEDPRAKVDEYLEHRLNRERSLIAALESGERSRAVLLDTVWDDVPEVLLPAAAMAMRSHLEKLDAEGRLPGELTD